MSTASLRAISRCLAALLALICAGASACEPAQTLSLRVMTFNAWGAGANDGSGPAATIAAIRAADADIVAFQEALAEGADCTPQSCPAIGANAASPIAGALGLKFHVTPESPLNWAGVTFSRYPIVATSSTGAGVRIDVEGTPVAVFNIHLNDYPYQPYQAVGIEYGGAPFTADPAELVEAARMARGEAIDSLRQELSFAEGAALTVVAGDFNEPSHRDWSAAAAESGRHPVAVDFPSVLALEKLGFVDTWRAAHPDEMASPGFTWTPLTPTESTREHHDRIDYVLVRGASARVKNAWIVGESADNADIVVRPWPSDHRAVVAEIEICRE